jgi:hypothetical protein
MGFIHEKIMGIHGNVMDLMGFINGKIMGR